MNSNFKRKKPKIYLAGGMENAPNFGVEWRERAEKWLTKAGWDVHNPCTKETTIFKRRGVKGSTYHKLKTKKTLDIYVSIMKDLIDFDKEVIRNVDMVLVYWDEYVYGGTIDEIGYARENSVPVILMSKLPLRRISGWVLGRADGNVFFTWKDIKEYLGDFNANRNSRRSKKRKRHNSDGSTQKISRKENVIRETPQRGSKKDLRLIRGTG